jgi:hypothetical protein
MTAPAGAPMPPPAAFSVPRLALLAPSRRRWPRMGDPRGAGPAAQRVNRARGERCWRRR